MCVCRTVLDIALLLDDGHSYQTCKLQKKKKKLQISFRTGLKFKVIVKVKKLFSKTAYDSAKKNTKVYT